MVLKTDSKTQSVCLDCIFYFTLHKTKMCIFVKTAKKKIQNTFLGTEYSYLLSV